MNRAKTIITLLTLICYLTATAVASAHGFSSGPESASDLTTSQMELLSEFDGGDCHSLKGLSNDNEDSKACEILCSVMAQAMSDTLVSMRLEAKPDTLVSRFRALPLTRQLTVEPRPPK